LDLWKTERMSQADLELNREIRKILIRHWIDLGRLSFRSVNGRVWIRGELHRIAGVQEELTPSLVDTIFSEMRRLRGIVSMNIELNNWIQSQGGWKPMESEDKTAPLISPDQTQGPRVHDIGPG